MKKAKRATLPEDWQPSADDIAYAESRGVPLSEAERFKDYHLMQGTLFASVRAGWRYWCQNAVKFGNASGKPRAPLLDKATSDPHADPFGAVAWARTLPDVYAATVRGLAVVGLCGIDVILQATECCRAAGFPIEWRGDLNPVAEWLRAGLDPDLTVEAIRTATKRPDRPNLRYYAIRVSERARAA